MNTSQIERLVATVAITLSVTTIGVTQATSGSPTGPGRAVSFQLGLMADYLEISDTQRGQIGQVIAAEKPALIPLIQQLTQTKQQIAQEVSSGVFDQAKIGTLAAQESQTLTQLTIERGKDYGRGFQYFDS